MTKEELKLLWRRLRKLRAEYVPISTDEVPPTIKLLRSLRTQATEDSEFIALTTLLESEYSWYGCKNEQEAIGREMTERFPEEPMPWISLAGFLLYEKEELDEASTVIEIALEKALNTGHFVRHAYNTKARIARKNKDYNLLEETLRNLASYSPQPGARDIAYEDDFLVDLPENAVTSEVLKKYRRKKPSGHI